MRKGYLAGLIFINVAIAITILGPARTSAQDAKGPAQPPRPAWVDADGKVNIDKAPKEVRAIDSEGKHMRDAGGSEKTVKTYIGDTPPPPLR